MEKTLKHELYKHGSYLHSLKESGSSFVNIDDEIKKLEELFQLASKKGTPPFAVGEYYVTNGLTFKVIAGDQKDRIQTLFLINGALVKSSRSLKDDTFKNSTPATAEQIATFKRAEQFASKGRKLDEFRAGDLVKDEYNQEHKITEVDVWGVDKVVSINIGGNNAHINAKQFDLIQTAEELQEVGDHEK